MSARSCKDCEERHEGCHSTCESYIKWKEQHDKNKEALNEWVGATWHQRKNKDRHIKQKKGIPNDWMR